MYPLWCMIHSWSESKLWPFTFAHSHSEVPQPLATLVTVAPLFQWPGSVYPCAMADLNVLPNACTMRHLQQSPHFVKWAGSLVVPCASTIALADPSVSTQSLWHQWSSLTNASNWSHWVSALFQIDETRFFISVEKTLNFLSFVGNFDRHNRFLP